MSPTESKKYLPGLLPEDPGLISATSQAVVFEVSYAQSSLPSPEPEAQKYAVLPKTKTFSELKQFEPVI